jgi:hypothetical protein
MQKTIKAMETKYLQPSLEMIEDVFTKWDSPEEGKVVRSLVEEIRSKKYYLPELELIMVNWKIRRRTRGRAHQRHAFLRPAFGHRSRANQNRCRRESGGDPVRLR